MARLLYEQIREIHYMSFTVRLWIAGCFEFREEVKRVEDFLKQAWNSSRDMDCKSLADDIINLDDKFNAVEVKNRFNSGTVIYRDWP